ncbi:MAG: aminotransferase class III-fold pyridoxal phosphate-dependent enzyme [Alphaproteobacteria bacterium]|nr:aminotransferase class III-fold pyridoxal phosphate-dependent enzyme [Alphaproteobacteria bacterium]
MLRNHPFATSEALLERALRTIPLGTQTFSKSKTQFPIGAAPLYGHSAQGSKLRDADGNEYLDFINGLLAISLGYKDPDVDAAVRAQLDDGVLFSLPHPVEIEVAERICDMVPCAEMVRFGKNGSDATAGAIRLARGFTGRDHVAVCGYHGWQDWYIGSTSRDLGVPKAVQALTHGFVYNDLDSLETLFRDHAEDLAAVIVEPMNVVYPAPGFLEGLREITERHGTLLIFDEMITGFRFANGGAQELFGVTPDLATFGKGLANGYPLAALTGRADIMRLLEDVFFSFTMGGETLSLAAAKAVLDKLPRENVVDHLRIQGEKVMTGVATLIERHGVGDFLSVSGHPAWSFLNMQAAGEYTVWQVRTLFLQEIFARGVLSLGSHNMSFAHSNDDIVQLLDTYNDVFPVLRDAIAGGTLEAQLRCDTLQPLFKVR